MKSVMFGHIITLRDVATIDVRCPKTESRICANTDIAHDVYLAIKRKYMKARKFIILHPVVRHAEGCDVSNVEYFPFARVPPHPEDYMRRSSVSIASWSKKLREHYMRASFASYDELCRLGVIDDTSENRADYYMNNIHVRRDEILHEIERDTFRDRHTRASVLWKQRNDAHEKFTYINRNGALVRVKIRLPYEPGNMWVERQYLPGGYCYHRDM